MDEREWREIATRINGDIGGIIRAQRVLADVNEELLQRDSQPIEDDFIDAEAYGQSPGEARTKIVDGVEILVRKLHRRGLHQSDVTGADLLYEVAGRKFVVIQYKTPSKRHRVERNEDQLKRLVESCPNPCPPNGNWFWPSCGSWFAVESSIESLYLPACEAQAVFGDASSRSVGHFGRGVSKEVFQQLFARCWIGARTAPNELAYLAWDVMMHDRVLVSVLQRGTFGRW